MAEVCILDMVTYSLNGWSQPCLVMEVHSSGIVENLQSGDTLPTKRDPFAFVDNTTSILSRTQAPMSSKPRWLGETKLAKCSLRTFQSSTTKTSLIFLWTEENVLLRQSVRPHHVYRRPCSKRFCLMCGKHHLSAGKANTLDNLCSLQLLPWCNLRASRNVYALRREFNARTTNFPWCLWTSKSIYFFLLHSSDTLSWFSSRFSLAVLYCLPSSYKGRDLEKE